MKEPVIMETMAFPEHIGGMNHYLCNNLARSLPARLYRHRSDTSDKKYCTCTRLAGYYWKKNFEGVAIDRDAYQWELVKKCFAYQPSAKKCDLCLSEKLLIMKNRDPRSLNKRTELMNSCLHRWKYRFRNWKPVPTQ